MVSNQDAGAGSTPAATADRAAITDTMMKYQAALNASSTDEVMRLYTEDGVFMPPYSPSAVGKAAVRKAYDDVFRTISLRVTFTIAEIEQMSPSWAFVRTTSAGTSTVNANKKQTAEGNQELFILRKERDDVWRIARYSFSSTNAH